MRPKGFIIDVPVTLSVAVRGATLEASKKIARTFADTLNPSQSYIDGYNGGAFSNSGVSITEVTLESNREDSCEVLEELEADDVDGDEPGGPDDAGRTFGADGVVSADWNQLEKEREAKRRAGLER